MYLTTNFDVLVIKTVIIFGATQRCLDLKLRSTLPFCFYYQVPVYSYHLT